MEINIPSTFVKLGDNIKADDIVTLLDEGEYKVIKTKEGDKDTLQFQMKLADGAEKTYTMNVTTQKNVIAEWGKDSKEWVGKELKVWVIKQLSFGRTTDAMILTPVDWTVATLSEKEGNSVPTINQDDN